MQMVFISGSKFFLEGIGRILSQKGNGIRITTKSSNRELRNLLNGIKPGVLFYDNRTLDLDIIKLRDLIKKESPKTMVILFGNKKRYKIDFPNIEYITKKTTCSELISLIRERKQIFGGNSRPKAREENLMRNENYANP